jgi:hypothetical protein
MLRLLLFNATYLSQWLDFSVLSWRIVTSSTMGPVPNGGLPKSKNIKIELWIQSLVNAGVSYLPVTNECERKRRQILDCKKSLICFQRLVFLAFKVPPGHSVFKLKL